MNGAKRVHGSRLRAIAERVFDRSTLDRVILPALADLQHECSAPSGRAISQRLICWRAYWSVWKTFGLCLVTTAVSNPHRVGGTIARRTAACLAGLVPVLVVPALPSEIFSLESRFTFEEALIATGLLLPQALLACLPSAFFFSLVVYRKDERPRGATVVPSVIAGTLVCVTLVGLLSGLVVPRANQAYRSFVFETLQRRAGVSELAPPAAPVPVLQGHIAFVALVPVLALLGYGLSNRGRSRRAMFAVALALQTLYYACFSLAIANFPGLYLHGPWAVNGAFLLLALWLVRPARVGNRMTS